MTPGTQDGEPLLRAPDHDRSLENSQQRAHRHTQPFSGSSSNTPCSPLRCSDSRPVWATRGQQLFSIPARQEFPAMGPRWRRYQPPVSTSRPAAGERLSGLSGDFDDIIANGSSAGKQYVQIAPSDVFSSQECSTWTLASVAAAAPPAASHALILATTRIPHAWGCHRPNEGLTERRISHSVTNCDT